MKYMGSKNKIAKYLLPHILKDRVEGQCYVEPFVGGCNLLDKVSGNRIGADLNDYLICMWVGLQQGFFEDGVFPLTITKDLYTLHRNTYKEHQKGNVTHLTLKDKAIIGWVGFMASFNGRFFDGGYSGHNVGGRDYIEEQIQNTVKQIPFVLGVEFKYSHYSDLVLPNNSIVYCDIPYMNTKQYATSKNFSHKDFFQWVRVMSEYHTIFISEYDAPSDFRLVTSLEVTNSMGTKNTYKPIEKLFTYG